MTWLITGGLGYIGSHILREIVATGKSVICLDNNNSAVREYTNSNCLNLEGDIRDVDLLQKIFDQNRIIGVVNCAALKSVPESFANPAEYQIVNFEAPKKLLELGLLKGIKYFIQSSTAAVYGPKAESPFSEDATLDPQNPYGESKLKFEEELSRRILSGDVSGTSLRFFNVCGASSQDLKDKGGGNLVTTVLKAIESDERPVIYGNSYQTPDGTCIRDFVDVRDVARAHVYAIEKLSVTRDLSMALNVGTGIGYSVAEVVSEILSQTKSKLIPKFEEARAGDIPIAVGNVERIKSELGFESVFNLKQMINTSV